MTLNNTINFLPEFNTQYPLNRSITHKKGELEEKKKRTSSMLYFTIHAKHPLKTQPSEQAQEPRFHKLVSHYNSTEGKNESNKFHLKGHVGELI